MNQTHPTYENADTSFDLASLSKTVAQIKEPDYWNILLISSDSTSHVRVKSYCQKITFERKPLRLISAYSLHEAIDFLSNQQQVALILIDTVSTVTKLGCKVADYVRNTLGNKLTRIIFLTESSELAPLEEVILKFDINDCKTKASLTQHNLGIMVVTSLKSYDQLLTIGRYRTELTMVCTNLATQSIELLTANEQLEQEVAERKQAFIEKESLLAAERQQRLLAETVAEASIALSSQLTQTSIFKEVLGQMRRLVPFDNAHIVLLEAGYIRTVGWEGYNDKVSQDAVSTTLCPLSDFPIDLEAVETRRPVIVSNTRQEPRWVVVEGVSWIMSYAVVPICVGERVLGLVRLDSDKPGAFKDEDIAFLQPLANVAAVALQNAELYDHAQLEITERKHTERALKQAHAQNEQLLSSISSILVGIGPDYHITHWNEPAYATFNLSYADVIGRPLRCCQMPWDWPRVNAAITECSEIGEAIHLEDVRYARSDGKDGFLKITITPFAGDVIEESGMLLLGEDITETRLLQVQLAQAQKLEAVGQLAAGIAHEINTPTQYIGDNVEFLSDSLTTINQIFEEYHQLLAAVKAGTVTTDLVSRVENVVEQADLSYLMAELPLAASEAMEGIERVTQIVRAMKEFSHPGVEEKTTVDLNHAIAGTITVARNEWKYVAEIETDLEPGLPLIACLPGEFNQVILNLLVNAAHAVADTLKDDHTKGKITVSTHRIDDWVEIRISDTGTGMPDDIRRKIFDPFFTTKEVGKGTGQGLAIAYAVIVDKHQGSISVDTEVGQGTTFTIKMPIGSHQPQELELVP